MHSKIISRKNLLTQEFHDSLSYYLSRLHIILDCVCEIKSGHAILCYRVKNTSLLQLSSSCCIGPSNQNESLLLFVFLSGDLLRLIHLEELPAIAGSENSSLLFQRCLFTTRKQNIVSLFLMEQQQVIQRVENGIISHRCRLCKYGLWKRERGESENYTAVSESIS